MFKFIPYKQFANSFKSFFLHIAVFEVIQLVINLWTQISGFLFILLHWHYRASGSLGLRKYLWHKFFPATAIKGIKNLHYGMVKYIEWIRNIVSNMKHLEPSTKGVGVLWNVPYCSPFKATISLSYGTIQFLQQTSQFHLKYPFIFRFTCSVSLKFVIFKRFQLIYSLAKLFSC